MKTMRPWAGTVVMAGMLALLAACGRDSGEGGVAGEGGDPESGGTVILAEQSDMNTPMPLLINSSLDGNLQDMLFMTLLRGEWRDGRLAYVTAEENPMALARSYEYVGADSASLRYHLRTDVRWSDGQPVTAHDVVLTYQLLRDPAVASPRQDYTDNIESVVAEDDATVVFNFTRRYPEMLFHSGSGIIPRHIYGGVAPAQVPTHSSITMPQNGGLVVSGAYQVSAWERGQRIVLTRNPHFEPRGHLDQIVVRIIPDATTRLVELQTGAVDWMNNVPFDQIPALRQRAPQLRFEREEKRFYDYIAYNPEALPQFADPEVRRALGQAIDIQGIIDALQMSEYAVPASGPYPPIFADLYDPEANPPLRQNLEEAKRLLAAKGWRDTNGDGIVELNGQPFRFSLVTNSNSQRRIDVAQIVQQQWRALGVEMELRTLEFNTFMQALIEQDFQAALGGWGVGLSPDLTGMWGPESPYNIVSYDEPDTQALFQQALAQPTAEAAAGYWRRSAASLVEDQPYTWLYYADQVDAINQRVRNTKVDTYGPYQNAWEWWIPRSEQRGGASPAPADTTD